VLGQLPIVNGAGGIADHNGSCLSQISPTLFTSVKTGRSRHFLITQRGGERIGCLAVKL